MRGEHFIFCDSSALLLGSSPHARGARSRLIETGGRAGIIPACAGSTIYRATERAPLGDHPRMRGEHTSRPARLVNIFA